MLLDPWQHAHADGKTGHRSAPQWASTSVANKSGLKASPWHPFLRGRHGEYLLSLTNGMDPVPDPTKAAFVLNIAEEVPGSHLFLHDFNQMEHIFLAGDQVLEDNGLAYQPLRRHQLHTMEIGLVTAANQTEAYVTQELHREAPAQRVLWEVYCGRSRTSQLAETMGMRVERFSLDNGWDFNLSLIHI